MQQISQKFLDEAVWNDFFNMIYAKLKDYTTSLNEYIYFVTFLYAEYMMPAVKAFLNTDA